MKNIPGFYWHGRTCDGAAAGMGLATARRSLPLAQVAEGYAAMDERRAIKTLLRP